MNQATACFIRIRLSPLLHAAVAGFVFSGDSLTEKLTERQIRFCQEYIIDLIGSAAAVRAGFSENSAADQACELLKKPHVKAYVDELLEDRASRTRATADKVLSELYYLIAFDPLDVFESNGCVRDIKDIPKEVRKTIASIEIFEEYSGKGSKNDPKEFIGYTKKIKFWDKARAIETLARHHKLLTDKTELSAPGGVPLLPPVIIFQDKDTQTKPQGSQEDAPK